MEQEDCLCCLLNCKCVIHQDGDLSTHLPKLSATTFKKGHVLCREFETSENFYLIKTGVVKIYSLSESGKQVTHAFLSTGELIGISGLTERKTASATAEILEEAELYILKKESAVELLKKHPPLLLQILNKVNKDQENAYIRFDRIINFKARERIARSLIDLGALFGESTVQGLQIKLRLTREELASYIGISPETAIRFLSEFKRKNLVIEKNHMITLLDQEALRNIR